MSHQTGIKANDQLNKFFLKCKDGHVRVFKVAIEEEQLVLKEHKNEKHNWEKDFDNWSPDTSPTRQKMLYASTKATLKQEFGNSLIKEELHGTVLPEVTLEGYKKHKKNVAAPAPLSSREEELQELKRTEINTDISINTKQQTLGGVSFPMLESAQDAIKDMARGSYDYIQLRIDIPEETIHLVTAENISLEKLPSKVPLDTARYHLYKFKHTHEGDYMENIVFIYSMPGYNCTVKERMLYSSCKNPLTEAISNLGLEIVKKIEIDVGSELTEQFLYEELHPTNTLYRPKFAKPKGPPGRGPKRMTKNH
ncbi:hypothetical protein GWI33_003024 [Rhynchophorus ferrugineus]|uniref:ADF-H domain-containing protein n=1 Tax=Rhynchophorus ferrugineus TaxID=354439 RepID=A0A834MKZ3_RHYFE|nr:hypothetical protein GWI33_003024 [Rhynchophorus ferrugineus]